MPHLTVGLDSSLEVMRRAERDIAPMLPVEGRAVAVTLMHESLPHGRWEVFASFPLG